jgi:hypothetical protein
VWVDQDLCQAVYVIQNMRQVRIEVACAQANIEAEMQPKRKSLGTRLAEMYICENRV